MRIISGKYKGRRIIAPKNLPIRPTTDMAKESLFNILNNHYYFDQVRVLDLFSGSGGISYEFASRGSGNIVAVDSDFGCIKFIRQTSDTFDFNINTVKNDVFSFLEKNRSEYDIIFADPPYHFTQEQFERIPKLIFENELLSKRGMLIIEHSSHTDFEEVENFCFLKKYGGSAFSFFALERDEDQDG